MIILLMIVLALCVGSFLNVVIYRLPRILLQNWRHDCQLFLQQPLTVLPKFTLSWPRSHCSHCQHALRWWHNIPLVSFCLLKGRCAFCAQKISWQYPFIEFLNVVLVLFLYQHFQAFSLSFFASVLFTELLIVLVGIDFSHQLLPDEITYFLLWMGLLLSLKSVFVTSEQAIIGAMVGYSVLWSLAWIYQRITHREGMGQGDFKLLAALGAWVGWQSLLGVLLLASCSGLLIAGGWIILKRNHKHTPFAFGPYLAMGGWIMLLWGQELQHLWLN